MANTTLYVDALTGVMDTMVTDATLTAKDSATIATSNTCEAGVKGATPATINTRDWLLLPLLSVNSSAVVISVPGK